MVKRKSEDNIEVFEIYVDDNKIKELKESKEHIHMDDSNGNHILLVHKNNEIL
jgi:hypothetical protein